VACITRVPPNLTCSLSSVHCMYVYVHIGYIYVDFCSIYIRTRIHAYIPASAWRFKHKISSSTVCVPKRFSAEASPIYIYMYTHTCTYDKTYTHTCIHTSIGLALQTQNLIRRSVCNRGFLLRRRFTGQNCLVAYYLTVQQQHIRWHNCVYICTYVCTYVCVCTCVCLSTFACVLLPRYRLPNHSAAKHPLAQLCVYACMYVCMYDTTVCVYMYVCMYVCV
jgi:hypothetical protein